MRMETSEKLRGADVVTAVRCLDCGDVYEKPVGGGTDRSNPGCPACGYVGWVVVEPVFTRGGGRRRLGAGLPPPRTA